MRSVRRAALAALAALVLGSGCVEYNSHVPMIDARAEGDPMRANGFGGKGGTGANPNLDGGKGGNRGEVGIESESDADDLGDPPDGLPPSSVETPSSPPSACMAGETRCATSGETVLVCTAAGTWITKSTCESVCEAGACAGLCKPGAKQCGKDQIPETCSAMAEWVPDPRCPFVCTGEGKCVGECVAGAKRCAGSGPRLLTPQVCDENGRWTDAGAACPNVCMNGSCGGSCMPGRKHCVGQMPETCSAEGTWTPGKKCPFLCSGDGVCGGECKPGDKRCDKMQPEACNAEGRWAPAGSPCMFACNKGACGGVCAPGSKQCAGTGGLNAQTCNASGQWVKGTTCPFLCSNGACSGMCKPDAKRCNPNGAAVQACSKDASGWRDNQSCELGCDAGKTACKTCDAKKEICDNGKDDDCDGLIDCLDPQDCGKGATCGADKVCNATQCVGCKANVPCGDLANKCKTETTDCSTGESTCKERSRKDDGSACGAPAMCVAGGLMPGDCCQAGACQKATQPMACPMGCEGAKCREGCPSGMQMTEDGCTKCGGAGEPCCKDKTCGADLACARDFSEEAEPPLKCVRCGHMGEPCCPTDRCEAPTACRHPRFLAEVAPWGICWDEELPDDLPPSD